MKIRIVPTYEADSFAVLDGYTDREIGRVWRYSNEEYPERGTRYVAFLELEGRGWNKISRHDSKYMAVRALVAHDAKS